MFYKLNFILILLLICNITSLDLAHADNKICVLDLEGKISPEALKELMGPHPYVQLSENLISSRTYEYLLHEVFPKTWEIMPKEKPDEDNYNVSRFHKLIFRTGLGDGSRQLSLFEFIPLYNLALTKKYEALNVDPKDRLYIGHPFTQNGSKTTFIPVKSYDELISLYRNGYRYVFSKKVEAQFLDDKSWGKYISENTMPSWLELFHDNSHYAVLSQYPKIGKSIIQYYLRVVKESTTPLIFKAHYTQETLLLPNSLANIEKFKADLIKTRGFIVKLVDLISNGGVEDYTREYLNFKLMADKFLFEDEFALPIGADFADGYNYNSSKGLENHTMWFKRSIYEYENKDDFIKHFDSVWIKIFNPEADVRIPENPGNLIKIALADPMHLIYHIEALIHFLLLHGHPLDGNESLQEWHKKNRKIEGAYWSLFLSSGNPWRDTYYYPLKGVLGDKKEKLAEYLLFFWHRFEAAMIFYVDKGITPEMFHRVVLNDPEVTEEERKLVLQYLAYSMSSDPENYAQASFNSSDFEYLANPETF